MKIAPSHTDPMAQERLVEKFNDHMTLNVWPPSSPDLNLLDYYI